MGNAYRCRVKGGNILGSDETRRAASLRGDHRCFGLFATIDAAQPRTGVPHTANRRGEHARAYTVSNGAKQLLTFVRLKILPELNRSPLRTKPSWGRAQSGHWRRFPSPVLRLSQTNKNLWQKILPNFPALKPNTNMR